MAPMLTMDEKNMAIVRTMNFLSLNTIFNPSIYFSFFGGILIFSLKPNAEKNIGTAPSVAKISAEKK